MQEEGRLECLCGHVSPIDEPVEGAWFPCRSEAVENKGSKAEDVEMDGLGGGPAPEQNVDANAQVNEGNEAKTLIDGAIFGFENDLDVKLGGAVEVDRLGNRTKDRVSRVCPDAAAKHLPRERGDAGSRLFVNGDEYIPRANTGAVAGREGWNSLGPETGGGLDPPDSIGWNVEAALPIKVQCCKDTGGNRRDC